MFLCLTSTEDSNLHAHDSAMLEDCITRIAYGDKIALSDIYEATSTSVYAYALSMLKNTHDAEDVLHDCFISIFSYAGAYKACGKPLAWILTITKNLCMQKFRQHKKSADIPQEDWQNYIEAAQHMDAEDKIVLQECMTNLTLEERQIIILHAVSGFKHREIAEITGLGLSTVLSKYNRALKKLKELLARGDREA